MEIICVCGEIFAESENNSICPVCEREWFEIRLRDIRPENPLDYYIKKPEAET